MVQGGITSAMSRTLATLSRLVLHSDKSGFRVIFATQGLAILNSFGLLHYGTYLIREICDERSRTNTRRGKILGSLRLGSRHSSAIGGLYA